MVLLLLLLAAASIAAPVLVKILGRPAFGLLSLVPLGGLLWILREFARGTFADGGALTAHYGWMPQAHLNLTLRLDSLAALFSVIILGVGTLVLLYCWGYFDSAPRRLRFFAGQMVGFAFAMYGLVISDNFLLMYVFWEITSVLSFMLVGYYGERASSRRSATQALMITALGGLVMLVGIVLLGTQTGVWQLSDIPNAQLEGVPYISAAMVLILAGALSKSAIAPAHFWLPGAMAAPTPVSAYLHSAAMVKAGIYLVARLSPDFNFAPAWHLVILPLGVVTMLMAGWMSLRQNDLKLVLAYGTVSQLGFIMTLVGIGSRDAMLAGLALTFAHSLFKACLFMVVGLIDHASGTRDLRKLSGLGRKEPLLFVLALIAGASMAGIPPLFGFVAKETALDAVLHEELLVGLPGQMLLVGLVLGSVLTMAYTLRFLYAFGGKEPSEAVDGMHKITALQYFPPAVLALLTVVFGIAPAGLDFLITTHVEGAHLELWHGFTIPLLLSAVIIVAGSIMHWQRTQIAKLHNGTPALGDADVAYDSVLDFLRALSLRLTASTQRGSLVINLGIIFAVLTVLPLVTLLLGERNDVRMQLWDNPTQAVVAFVAIAVAIAATVQANRLSALILVGITGYAMAMIFALQGAPDLALTQLLVDTATVVVFMLVMRRFPAETQWKQDPKSNRFRAWLSIAVGLSVMILTVFAINARTTEPIAVKIPDLAYEIGHGANAVNVLLVDIRAWDTFGEITVLIIAAIGIASLVFRTRDFHRASRRPTVTSGRRWLAARNDSEKMRNRSIMVDVVTRMLFPTMIVLSIYFFFAGHNAPGGGFAGGLVAALALTLRYLAGGPDELEEALPVDPSKLLGLGLLASAAAAVWPMLLGYPPLTSFVWEIGDVHIASALLFDLGVYLIVVGLVLSILHSLGGQLDKDEEMRKQRARDRARKMRQKVKQW
ncbi:Na+/H+ antiporter subunit A [Corynebacterium sp. 153RC1]|uniref:Na+/H+ antiporter subunit A n=1 Tax=unclassified Corynebacterium TaxID=2624378 RepID=UPI00211BDDC3|nr:MULTISPECIES: Na+/H+ antiporter subunit A [unclassified Corynebacterium]MCQ9352504.1 Na+/H+ antiporter subunit A [Corynebacterium sp. 209RC1]MCQ9354688.1 Na+/H+ antiporter subunit A [Corynebacterium sp. 1222RC1]MCQ9356799.1 Na+/H+ antiporter subunit A [Corynebacterium sp. 122RC1]MCQ9358997.1 Na+/H+ antiporter subunit A [Corynebacterium sp. 142RC1]MCQ9361267.1 Na+/H+ antiporter subunit A [Corynebacterium sp. 153RC1]